MTFTQNHHIHFTGIKGVGMTALALCTQDLGITISGSDLDEPFVTDAVLKRRRIPWQIGFAADHLPPATSLVVYTAAHQGRQNPEVTAALNRGIPILNHAQALEELMQGKIGISVCGVGGKTTTSAMLSHILDRLGAHPSFCIGVGDIASLGGPGRYDRQGQHFVAEADEYTADPTQDFMPRFNYQHPQIIICTNIEFDHPDVYRDLNHTQTVFLDFFNHLPSGGLLLISADSAINQSILPQLKIPYKTYSPDPHISISLPGDFNLANATAAVEAAVTLGFNHSAATAALADFTGTKRRFEHIATINGIDLYDDYAHHPREIQATLTAAKAKFPHHQLIVIFQPHTYSRTKALFSEFTSSFTAADKIIFLPIYASARESPDPTVSSQKLAQATPNGFLASTQEDLLQYLKAQVNPPAVIFTLGAGDIFLLHDQIIAAVST